MNNEEGKIIKGNDWASCKMTAKRATKGITRGGNLCKRGTYRYYAFGFSEKMKRIMIEKPNYFRFLNHNGTRIKLSKIGIWLDEKDVNRFLIFLQEIRDTVDAEEYHLQQLSEISIPNCDIQRRIV